MKSWAPEFLFYTRSSSFSFSCSIFHFLYPTSPFVFFSFSPFCFRSSSSSSLLPFSVFCFPHRYPLPTFRLCPSLSLYFRLFLVLLILLFVIFFFLLPYISAYSSPFSSSLLAFPPLRLSAFHLIPPPSPVLFCFFVVFLLFLFLLTPFTDPSIHLCEQFPNDIIPPPFVVLC